MCDYSLAYFPNRLAVEGEQLVVHRFPCGTLGLASSRRTLWQRLFPSGVPAVCVPPGARLRIEDIARPLGGSVEPGRERGEWKREQAGLREWLGRGDGRQRRRLRYRCSLSLSQQRVAGFDQSLRGRLRLASSCP